MHFVLVGVLDEHFLLCHGRMVVLDLVLADERLLHVYRGDVAHWKSLHLRSVKMIIKELALLN